MRFELIVFDLDGTLADTRRDLAESVNYALRSLGRSELPLATVAGFVGDGLPKLMERVLGETTNDEFDNSIRLFREYYAEHLADYSRLYDGMREALRDLDGAIMTVLSNKPTSFTEPLVVQLGIRSHFQMVMGGEPGVKLKPDPEAVLKIVDAVGAASERCVIVGDGVTDMGAGKAAGIATCAVTWGFKSEEELRALEPDFVVRHPRDLIHVLR